jgi:hypothetical protein
VTTEERFEAAGAKEMLPWLVDTEDRMDRLERDLAEVLARLRAHLATCPGVPAGQDAA